MVASAGLPEEVAETYSRLCVAAGQDAQAWQRMQAAGPEDPPMDRQDFKRVQRDQAPIWLQLAGRLGLTPE